MLPREAQQWVSVIFIFLSFLLLLVVASCLCFVAGRRKGCRTSLVSDTVKINASKWGKKGCQHWRPGIKVGLKGGLKEMNAFLCSAVRVREVHHLIRVLQIFN